MIKSLKSLAASRKMIFDSEKLNLFTGGLISSHFSGKTKIKTRYEKIFKIKKRTLTEPILSKTS